MNKFKKVLAIMFLGSFITARASSPATVGVTFYGESCKREKDIEIPFSLDNTIGQIKEEVSKQTGISKDRLSVSFAGSGGFWQSTDNQIFEDVYPRYMSGERLWVVTDAEKCGIKIFKKEE